VRDRLRLPAAARVPGAPLLLVRRQLALQVVVEEREEHALAPLVQDLGLEEVAREDRPLAGAVLVRSMAPRRDGADRELRPKGDVDQAFIVSLDEDEVSVLVEPFLVDELLERLDALDLLDGEDVGVDRLMRRASTRRASAL
jgi:hypothetical protein